MRILVFGDSITQGYFDIEKGGWCNRLSLHAMQLSVESDWKKDFSIFNLGISGDSLSRLSERFEVEFGRRNKNEECLTIFAYGINDSMSDDEGICITDEKEFQDTYSTYIKKAKERGMVVLVGLAPTDESVLAPIPWHPTHSYLDVNRIKYTSIIESLASEWGCVFVSLENVFDKKTANYTLDGVHPNSEGHKLIFERVKSVLEDKNLL
jgi:lysophospholipase L1-like esterase